MDSAVATSEAPATVAADTTTVDADEAVVLEDLLVEDVSIDGMCGVY
nr:mycofactocin precursor MftA [Micromonospora sp. DSM 115978]